MMREQPRPAAGVEATIVNVALGDRSYDIVIGEDLLDGSAGLIGGSVPGARLAVVSDDNVAALYLPKLRAELLASGLYLGEVVVTPGEASKSFPTLARLCEKLLELGVERGDAVIALGGGVIGDLAGFAASILRRGVRLVQIPTTLLAQVDSSIGGKTGIDTPQGKNLIGAFHQPSLVLADISVLATLAAREFRAGYAEMMKYGLIGDAPFFAWLEENFGEIFSGEGPQRGDAIATSCRAKAAIVGADEREESGMRALLNLGHTFAHAIEREYQRMDETVGRVLPHLRPDLDHHPGHIVTQDEGRAIGQDELELSVPDLAVQRVHAGRVHLHQRLVVTQDRIRHACRPQRALFPVAIENKGFYGASRLCPGRPGLVTCKMQVSA